MEKQKIYFLLDNVLLEYENYYQEDGEKNIINDLKEYLPSLSINSQIIMITSSGIEKTKQWLLDNDLNNFIDYVHEPAIFL